MTRVIKSGCAWAPPLFLFSLARKKRKGIANMGIRTPGGEVRGHKLVPYTTRTLRYYVVSKTLFEYELISAEDHF